MLINLTCFGNEKKKNFYQGFSPLNIYIIFQNYHIFLKILKNF
jgi:hypothetical protein